MRIAIVEDETEARNYLQTILGKIDSTISVTASLRSIAESVNYFQNQPLVDLVLMDIELSDGQSFEIFNQATVDVPVIFITGYQEYTLKAFKLNSIDYLLKPVDKEELSSAITKYRKLHTSPPQKITPELLSFLKKAENKETARTRYLVKNGTRLVSIAAESIAYFYRKERSQYIKTQAGEDYMVDEQLDEIEADMDTHSFFRANRQFILNYHCIHKIQIWFSGKLKVDIQPGAYEEIIVSKSKAAEFKKWLGHKPA